MKARVLFANFGFLMSWRCSQGQFSHGVRWTGTPLIVPTRVGGPISLGSRFITGSRLSKWEDGTALREADAIFPISHHSLLMAEPWLISNSQCFLMLFVPRWSAFSCCQANHILKCMNLVQCVRWAYMSILASCLQPVPPSPHRP